MSTQPWFIAPPSEWGPAEIILPKEESHHALKVMRVAPPDVITIIDGHGSIARCAAARIDGGRLVAEVLEREDRRPVTPEIAVYQGAAKGGKIDEVVERLAEMGVAETNVFTSERSVVRWDDKKRAKLAERWAAIAGSAAKQSKSPFIMRTDAPLEWSTVLRRIGNEASTVVLWEGASLPLRTALHSPVTRVAVVVGPEGGFFATRPRRSQIRGVSSFPLAPGSFAPRSLRSFRWRRSSITTA